MKLKIIKEQLDKEKLYRLAFNEACGKFEPKNKEL